MIVVVIVVHQVLNAYLITAPKTVPISSPVVAWNRRMPVFVTVVHIRRSMVLRILAGAFDPVMKTLLFDALQLGRRNGPRLLSGWSSQRARNRCCRCVRGRNSEYGCRRECSDRNIRKHPLHFHCPLHLERRICLLTFFGMKKS